MKYLLLIICTFAIIGCSNNPKVEEDDSHLFASPTPMPSAASFPEITPENNVASVAEKKESEKSITDQIKVFAEKEYPDDYNMQKFIFDQQMEAYNFMQKQPSSDIKTFSEKEYPEDYNMQKFIFEQQTEARDFMTKLPASKIKSFAEKEYPNDYNMQKFIYEQQLEAKKEMDNS